jgi:hypothetical protein
MSSCVSVQVELHSAYRDCHSGLLLATKAPELAATLTLTLSLFMHSMSRPPDSAAARIELSSAKKAES